VTDLAQAVEASILEHGLLQPGEPVLVAVSGGIDSMVLLHVLHGLAPRHNWKLAVAHLNHQLRGRASDLDEKLVRVTAAALKCPFAFERANVKRHAEEQKLSMEMAAREVRHSFLARNARSLGIAKIALAHHADDQVELFFVRLLRGAGPDGLAGMKWSNPSPASARVRLIRPLLDCGKTELRAYAEAKKISFREDATNTVVDIFRNRIRHELIPLLEAKYQPALPRVIARLIDLLGAESEVMAESAHKLRTRRSGLAKAPLALQRRVLQQQIIEMGYKPQFSLVEWLRMRPGKPICLGTGVRLSADEDGKVQLLKQEAKPFETDEELAVDWEAGAGEVVFGGKKLGWQVEAGSNLGHSLPKHQSGREYFDADKVGAPIILRNWRAGDRFWPIGMKGMVKLQDWFTDLKIPREQRHRLVIATTGSGDIFWIQGQRISEKFKLRPETRRRLDWRCE
jgi:tRNA(Ile)-lysidine synthase